MGRENFCVADSIAASCSVIPSSVSIPFTTFVTEYLALSGLNSGVSMNCKNRFAMRLRSPVIAAGSRPRFSRSASRSASSTISRVNPQSNSFTVHLTCTNTSRRSSVDTSRLVSSRSASYRRASSLARTVNGVSTSTSEPSLRSHRFVCDMSSSARSTLRSLLALLAAIRSLPMVRMSSVSLASSRLMARRRASVSGGNSASTLAVSRTRHCSSSP